MYKYIYIEREREMGGAHMFASVSTFLPTATTSPPLTMEAPTIPRKPAMIGKGRYWT